MARIPVNSSNLKAVEYQAEGRVLEVEFTSGGLYAYTNVPEQVYLGLLSAASKGAYFHAVIRDKYPTRRIR